MCGWVETLHLALSTESAKHFCKFHYSVSVCDVCVSCVCDVCVSCVCDVCVSCVCVMCVCVCDVCVMCVFHVCVMCVFHVCRMVRVIELSTRPWS